MTVKNAHRVKTGLGSLAASIRHPSLHVASSVPSVSELKVGCIKGTFVKSFYTKSK